MKVMNIGIYDLTITNDGNGIYINSFLVDDKISCPDYWKGWDNWVEILLKNNNYDYLKRSEIIKEIKNK